MFAGLLELDWTALEHAYGSADDVPSMLRALASGDAAERASALDEFYRAVHHHGNVYDSTVASLPFLFELAADTDVADRGPVIELITSIGTAGDGAFGGSSTPYQEANALVRKRAEEFVSWMADDDAAVRRATALAVAGCVADAERVIALFQERIAVEADAECRIAMLRAAANLAAHDPWSVGEQVTRWLKQVLDGGGDPGTRLAAFVLLARLARDRPDDSVVNQAIELLREAADLPTGELLEDLNHALGDHVPGRVALIEDQLRHPDPVRRVDALRLAGELMRGWRGSYSRLVTLIGAQLAADEPRVRRMALLALKNKFDLVAPAADALAERVAALGPDAWNSADLNVRKDHRELVVALARLGDERVLPIVEAALTQDGGARTLGGSLAKYRAHADRFVPTLRAGLDVHAGELDSGSAVSLFGLLSAVRELGAAEAVPEVLRVLDAGVRGRMRLVMEVALKTLASLGSAAAEAYDMAAELASDEEQTGQVALRAIEACWLLRGEADTLLPLLEPRLRETDWFSDGTPAVQTVVSTAAEVAGTIGPQAAPLAGHLRTLMTSAEGDWTRVESAIALIRVAGPAVYSAAEPQLETAWHETPHARVRIAECIRDLGTTAESFHPILRAELATSYRHAYTPGMTDSDEVRNDERLLTLCAQALDGTVSRE